MPLEMELRIGVNLDCRFLSRAYPRKLGFLEISGHPNLGRDNRKYLLACCDVIAHLNIAFGDPAILWRLHHGPRKVQIGLVEASLRLFRLALELPHLRIGLADPLRHRLSHHHLCLRLCNLSLRLPYGLSL